MKLAAPLVTSRSPKRALLFDAVIFDIDNVLVDTRLSYLEAIRWTIDIYLTSGNVPFFQLLKKSSSPQILSPRDVEQFKLLGGFNDDWDCCYGLLVYLLNLPVQGRTVSDLKKAMHLERFAASIKRKPLGVSGITKQLGRPSQLTIEKISRIFQEVYLGKNVFERVERKPAQHWSRRGLIHKEKLLFRIPTLRKLKNEGIALGIATGRSRFEALFALRHFGVADFFDAVTTMDDVHKAEKAQRESLRKPHPFSLIETAKKIGRQKRFVYVGDLPDDMLAAQRAKSEIQIQSVGFTACAFDPAKANQEMHKIKADYLLKKPALLYDILKGAVNPIQY